MEQGQVSKEELFEFFEEKIRKQNIKDFEIPTILNSDIEEESKVKDIFTYCFEDIKNILETYLDMEDRHYQLISLWIIGTYFHQHFQSYPYLYINAMRGSGKSRLLGLISELSFEGTMQNSMTEAVLFRTKGTLCIDEFESGVGRKGFENLRELLNSAYKKGIMVKRMKKQKTQTGEEQIVESFDVYRPIAMANISGIESVLGDRCIKIIIEKSINEKKTKLIENYRNQEKIKVLKFTLIRLSQIQCSLCSVVSPENVSIWWNGYLLEHRTTLTTLYSLTSITTLTTLKTLLKNFEDIKNSGINGRDLELSMPLLVISMWIDGELKEGTFEQTLEILKKYSDIKKEEESIENADISLIEFCSIQPETSKDYFVPIKNLTERFKEHLQTSEEWLNDRWLGRALTRLKLTKMKRRLSRGTEVIVDIKKAQEKMVMFR